MDLAGNSLQVFGFRGVVCKIFGDKELARCWPTSVHEQGVRSNARALLASERPFDYEDFKDRLRLASWEAVWLRRGYKYCVP